MFLFGTGWLQEEKERLSDFLIVNNGKDKLLPQIIRISEKLINELRIDYVVQENNFREMPLVIEIGKKNNVDTVYFSLIVNWGTWTNEQYMYRAVYSKNHPEYDDFIKVLSDPILDDDIVDLGNVTQFKELVS